MRIEIIEKGGQFCVRERTFLLWLYWTDDGTWFWPDTFSWESYEKAKRFFDYRVKQIKEQKAKRASKKKIVYAEII